MTDPHDRPAEESAVHDVAAEGAERLARLLAARPDDVWLAHDVSPERIERIWLADAAVCWTATHPLRDVRWLTGVGEDLAGTGVLVTRALEDCEAAGEPVSGTTVIDATHPLLPPARRAPSPDRWSWWWTRTPPDPCPGESDVVPLEPTDPRLAALLTHSASVYVFPGDPRVRVWYGIVRRGSLVSCGAHVQHLPGVPHLASVVTRPDHRGAGLAAAVCARLTRDALADGFGLVSLGMYAGNVAAQRVYERLGFTCAHVFASGYLPGMAPPDGVPEHEALPADGAGTA